MIRLYIALLLISSLLAGREAAGAQGLYHEDYRPQIHFSPKEKWTNDPNGMVFYKGTYHLFFQFYPGAMVWGPMHWGHAISKDLVHWKQEPIALYPDSLGYIFSGSAVVDKNNTSGFGTSEHPPLVAIFTHHDPKGARAGRTDFQNESIAFSLDNGMTWTKYAGNPVLRNPGITDFRDPKVMWFAPGKKWVMTLATKDRVTFYSSPDLKTWSRESAFGESAGAHGGVWECPDLFPLDDHGKTVWILIVNVNPGGPNGGSATQYFVGDFDGHTFTPADTTTRWLDYGPDEYAGITWSNTGNRRIFLGWMSNWLYANKVPTTPWRNAMTIPRELRLVHAGGDLFVASMPVRELETIGSPTQHPALPCRIDLDLDDPADLSIQLGNEEGEALLAGYDKANNRFFIDRSKAGMSGFYDGFAAVHTAPRLSTIPKMHITLVADVSSVELFADDGLTVMSEIFFPDKPFTRVQIRSTNGSVPKNVTYVNYASIWP
jgi:fructan beta-fructosidase